MCGIVGTLNLDGSPVDTNLLREMTGCLKHRGPDDEGYVLIDISKARCEPRAGHDTTPEIRQAAKHILAPLEFPADLAFGHRRLSIIDLSPAGHQPMCNEDKDICIVYNGEIYNYQQIRRELVTSGHQFQSNTDTEVVVHAYEEWGTDCLQKFNGMWAFAIWDGKEKKLFCSRDRFGIKPFYYFFDSERFLFASEIKALLVADFVPKKQNDRAVYDYLAYWLIDHVEETFFAGVRQLKGGYYLELHQGEKVPRVQQYYDIPLGNKPDGLSEEEYERQFYKLFEDSVRLRLISDVPVGSCLSGGLDSSSVVCVIDKLMREQGVKVPGTEGVQKTFSARYEDRRHDEGSFIQSVAEKARVDAHYTYPTAEGLIQKLERLMWHQEQPFTSTSIYAQWEVFELVKTSGVKVVLDGQGGDELLAGYLSYLTGLFSDFIKALQWRSLITEFRADWQLPHNAINIALLIAAFEILPQSMKNTVRRIMRVGGNRWIDKNFAARFEEYPPVDSGREKSGASSFTLQSYRSIMSTSIPSYLRYEDKNSMAHSVEARVPFLDHRLVEFAFSLPWNQKIFRGTRKRILRNAMKGIIPESVRNRKDKIAFGTPEDIWFKKKLRGTALEIINSESFQQRPFFNAGKVKETLGGYQQGRMNIISDIWRCVNLELWLRLFID
jgi:asparagine synthase (glutamine-hydrolysing)